MRLFKKAALWLAIVLGFELVGAMFLSLQALSSKSSVAQFTSRDLVIASNLRSLGANYWKYDDDMNNYVYFLVSHQLSTADSFKAAAIQDAASMHRALSTIMALAPSGSSVLKTAQRINIDLIGYDINSQRVFKAASQGDALRAQNDQINGNGSVSNDLTTQLPVLTNAVELLETQQINSVGSNQTTLLVVAIIVSVGGLILVLGLGVGFKKLVVAPLDSITRYLDHMLHGTNPQATLDTTRLDEFGELARVVQFFGETVTGVVEATGHFSQQVHKLETASKTINESAEGTASTSTEVNAAVEEVVQNITSVVASTGELRTAIREIANNASSAAGVARDAVDFAEGVSTDVESLGMSIQEIESVIAIINSIAEQTNLLALNAAIEAARAGDAGRGFAVVAGEVKELANGTQEATKDIRSKIDAMQNESRKTVTSVDQVKAYILKISDLQNSIASAVEEQSVTTDEISRMTQIATESALSISDATRSLSSAAESTLLSASLAYEVAEGVDGAAGHLKVLTSKFAGVKPQEPKDPELRFGVRESYLPKDQASKYSTNGNHANH